MLHFFCRVKHRSIRFQVILSALYALSDSTFPHPHPCPSDWTALLMLVVYSLG